MSSLEDLLPEMAGVFAAQESALENCVAVLTTQLQNLGQDHSRQTRRVVVLESSQRSLQQTVESLQETVAALQLQNEQLQQQQQAQVQDLESLRNKTPTVDLSGLQQAMATELQTHAAQLVERVVTTQLAELETKMSTQMDERLLDSSHRAFLRAQQSEEAMQAQLELLEKRFDYLTKIKMEIKELGKRMERQDQTLDDMRTGLSLLAKSVGTDEIDDEEDNDRDQQEENEARRSSRLEMETVVEIATPLILPTHNEKTEQADSVVIPEPVEQEIVEETPAVVEPIEEAAPAEPPVEQPPPEPVAVKEAELSPPPTPPPQPQQQPEDTTPQHAVADTEPEVVSEPVTPPPPECESPPPSTREAAEPEPVVSTPPADEQPPPPQIDPPLPPVETVEPPSTEEPVVTPLPLPEVLVVPTAVVVESPDAEGAAAGDDDTFNSSPVAPAASFSMHHRPSTSQLQHMPTAPSLSTVAYIRSRRQERTAKRGSRRESSLEADPPSGRRLRTPLSRDEIKVLWNKVFTKIIQLRRLQAINGTSAERTLFRKQHISMGARVKRLEETTSDLEDTMEMLEANIHSNTQTLQALHQGVAQSSSTLDRKTNKLDEVQKLQAQTIVGIQEKFEALEAEFRRVRNVSRKESVQNSNTTQQLAMLAVELMDVANKLKSHSTTLDTHDATLQQLVQKDLPSLTQSVQQAMLELRTETDFKTRELAKDLAKTSERLSATQASDHHKLETQVNDSVDALYRDFLVLTSALLVAVELAARQNASIGSKPTTNSPTKKGKIKTPLDVSVALLQSVVATFEGDCRKVLKQNQAEDDDGAAAIAAMLFEKLDAFRVDLGKLTQQADKAVAIASDADASSRGGTKTKAFEDHLVLLCTNQLRILEEILVSQSRRSGGDEHAPSAAVTAVIAHVKDLVIQLRAVLFLLVLHAQLVQPPQQIHALELTQTVVDTKLSAHEFALSQLATVEAVVKLMNTRLDGFLEMSLEFAKDADVKRSIQDLLNTSDAIRDAMTKQVDATHSEAVQRDELMERELAQLAGRVHKKLDKDEMLWTQEVLERQLAGVAKNALGEQDLLDIQRALRAKMDKTQFHSLLQQQHAKLLESGALDGAAGGRGNQPLATATHCISCNNELPPSPSQLRATVQEEVRHEVAKALAAARVAPSSLSSSSSPSSSSSSPSFNASAHRSMDKHKKELLLAALQQQKK